MDKKNFLNWYCWYATPEEIRTAVRTNEATINRLINEYSYEIEMIRTTKRFYDTVRLPEGVLPESTAIPLF